RCRFEYAGAVVARCRPVARGATHAGNTWQVAESVVAVHPVAAVRAWRRMHGACADALDASGAICSSSGTRGQHAAVTDRTRDLVRVFVYTATVSFRRGELQPRPMVGSERWC